MPSHSILNGKVYKYKKRKIIEINVYTFYLSLVKWNEKYFVFNCLENCLEIFLENVLENFLENVLENFLENF